jgi:hypothetical protein
VAEYAGVVWPLHLNSKGDYAKGSQRDVLKSDIRTVLQTRRFQSLESGGERLMRPGAFGLVPVVIFDIFNPDILTPLIKAWVEDALYHLVRAGKMEVLDLRVTPYYKPTEGYRIFIKYLVKEENMRDEYETEIETIRPASAENSGRF